MAYQPLARTYRPACFAEFVGQDAVAKALANAILTGRVLTNLIFTGVRGVGKTTVARLYAKALNCAQREPGSAEPCGLCESCLAIAAGHHEDVLEIDGASNTGVADVRALQETIDYAPRRSHYKVYIIDEVHMLSQAAFNALLKTLEERLPHVVFVFATTELDRVPETIRSRCPTFHLRKFPRELIARRLAEIVAKEGLAAEPEALAVIAREGHGSMRDALTLLDQAIALGGGIVTLATLGPMVSRLSSSPYLDLLAAMVARDAKAAMLTIEGLDQSGAELTAVTEELCGFARHAFVVRELGVTGVDAAFLGLDEGELERLAEIARAAPALDLNRIFRTLVKCRTELSGEALDRFVLENYVFEWCLDPGLPNLEDLRGGAKLATASMATTPAPLVAPGRSLRAGVQAAIAAQPRSGNPATSTAPAAAPTPGAAPLRTPPPATPPPASAAAPQPRTPTTSTTPTPPTATPPTATPAPASPSFPTTWKAMLEALKRPRAVLALKLEATHLIEYGPAKIALAVDEKTHGSLLSKDEQVKLKDQLQQLFGFSGGLVVFPRAAAASAAPLQETLKDTRVKAEGERQQKLVEEARNAPFTKEVLAVFGGAIEDVKTHSAQD